MDLSSFIRAQQYKSRLSVVAGFLLRSRETQAKRAGSRMQEIRQLRKMVGQLQVQTAGTSAQQGRVHQSASRLRLLAARQHSREHPPRLRAGVGQEDARLGFRKPRQNPRLQTPNRLPRVSSCRLTIYKEKFAEYSVSSAQGGPPSPIAPVYMCLAEDLLDFGVCRHHRLPSRHVAGLSDALGRPVVGFDICQVIHNEDKRFCRFQKTLLWLAQGSPANLTQR